MYIAATICVMLIPRDVPARANALNGASAVRRALDEIREGWHFAITHRVIFIALLQLALTNTLILTMAEMVPGFARRVLGLQPEDASMSSGPPAWACFSPASSSDVLDIMSRANSSRSAG